MGQRCIIPVSYTHLDVYKRQAPGKPKEVLISDDPPDSQATRAKRELTNQPGDAPDRRRYPEWDWRQGAYRDPGATVLLLSAPSGPQQWVDDTLEACLLYTSRCV